MEYSQTINNKPLLSIIIPVYNVENYIRETLKSILGQSFKNLELILIDDGSVDSSGTICKEFVAIDARIKYYYQENQGVSSARNLGLLYSTGEYVYFVDSDDCIIRDKFDAVIDALCKYNADIIHFGFEYIEENIVKDTYLPSCTGYFDKDSILKELICNPALWLHIFKKDLIGDQLKFSENIKVAEDTEFVIKAFLQSENYLVCSSLAYRHYKREGSIMTSQMTKEKVLNHLQVANNLMGFYMENKYNIGGRDILCFDWIQKYIVTFFYNSVYLHWHEIIHLKESYKLTYNIYKEIIPFKRNRRGIIIKYSNYFFYSVCAFYKIKYIINALRRFRWKIG